MILFLETIKSSAEMCPNTFTGQMYHVYLKNKNHNTLYLNDLFSNSF